MKTTILLIISSALTLLLSAQVPGAFKYQAVVRDNTGQIMENRPIPFRITILSGSTNGTAVYRENHTTITTNHFGLADIEIGKGTPELGSFSNINWGSSSYFIKVELFPSGASGWQEMGTAQLLAVPYALLAKRSEGDFSGHYNDLTNKPSLAGVATSGSYYDLSDKPVTDGSETKITAGTNITINGTGTAANPYKINGVSTHYPGERFGGGVVFYVDHTGEHGLIVNMVNLKTEVWSNVTDSVGSAAESPWNGKNNTQAIIGQTGHTASAARICDEYSNPDYGTGIFSDWYLPSINQLSLLYVNVYEVNKALDGDGNNSTTPIFYKPYWFSTENWNIFARGYAYFFNFESNVCDRYSKSNPLEVRAVRSF